MSRSTKPIWRPGVNVFSTEGVGPLLRREPNQQEKPQPVDPQPSLMVVVLDEADPHAHERSSLSVQYGVLYCARPDDVQDGDKFWFHGYYWGVLGAARWDIEHALTQVNFGVKQFRIRKGG